MSSTAAPFGTPVTTGESQATQSVNGQAASGNEPQELVDPNDPKLTSEPLDVNTEGDAYAQPAPAPDGKYRVKLKLMQVDDGRGNKVDYIPGIYGKDKQYCFASAVEARIIDPSGRYDNLPLYDHWVSTFMGRDKSTKIATILARLKQPDGSPWVKPGARLSAKDWIETFVRALAGEPEIGVETQWGWNCQACSEEARKKNEKGPREILGMNKFPVDAALSKPGKPVVYLPEMKCQVNPAHGYSRAQVRIARFISLGELK